MIFRVYIFYNKKIIEDCQRFGYDIRTIIPTIFSLKIIFVDFVFISVYDGVSKIESCWSDNQLEKVKELFARNITRLRNETGITQSELSLKLGLARNAVSRWESAELMPRAESLEKLASYFNVPKSVFFANDGNEQYASYGKMLRLPVVNSLTYDSELHLLTFDSIESYELIAEEYAQEEGQYFFFKAQCSCIERRILPGDLILIHQQDTASNGEICLILINEKLYLRRLVNGDTFITLYAECPTWSRMQINNYYTDQDLIISYDGAPCACLPAEFQVNYVKVIGRAVRIHANM